MRAAEIPGLVTEPELEALEELARSMPEDAQVVEIGSWQGRSTVAIYDALPPGARLSAVDTFEGDAAMRGTFGEVDAVDLRARFDRHTAGCERLDVVQLPSVEASARFAPRSLDWVFIDADHSYRAVVADIRAWAPKVKPGGVISGHDFGRAGVTDAVRTFFPLAAVEVSGSVWHTRAQARLRPAAVARISLRRLLR